MVAMGGPRKKKIAAASAAALPKRTAAKSKPTRTPQCDLDRQPTLNPMGEDTLPLTCDQFQPGQLNVQPRSIQSWDSHPPQVQAVEPDGQPQSTQSMGSQPSASSQPSAAWPSMPTTDVAATNITGQVKQESRPIYIMNIVRAKRKAPVVGMGAAKAQKAIMAAETWTPHTCAAIHWLRSPLS